MEKVDEYIALKNQGSEEELEDIRTAETAIITNNFHEFRATRIAKNKGIKNAESFAAETYKVMLPHYMLREAFGIVHEFFSGNLSIKN